MAVPAVAAICVIPPIGLACAAAADAALVTIYALSAIIVAVVATETIEGALDKADAKADPKVDPRVIECNLVWQSYKAYVCSACTQADIPELRRLKRACWGSLAMGRRRYLDMRCDYILPGSIEKGSAEKEKNHTKEWQKAVDQVDICDNKPHKPAP